MDKHKHEHKHQHCYCCVFYLNSWIHKYKHLSPILRAYHREETQRKDAAKPKVAEDKWVVKAYLHLLAL